ncbi:hypothetical protein OF83DRAFT_1160785 [Amylostereum chailletii]|nr:hypothetical protein OF83DRAFT_1160785 [Amylostereum chailletii]
MSFWVPMICILFATAIALEVALFISNRNRGWETGPSADHGVLHYVYTLPPVVIAMLIVSVWAWTDIEIKRLQQLFCLVLRGSQQTLCRDAHYCHGHRGHGVSACSGSFIYGAEYVVDPPRYVLFTDIFSQYIDEVVEPFLGASGFAAASVVYGLPEPPFVFQGYTVGKVDLPLNLVKNGTVTANTTAIHTNPQCRDPNEVQFADGSGWNNSAVFDGCTFSWSVNKSAEQLFGAETMPTDPPCPAFNVSSTSEVAQIPVIFWFFTYEPSAMASVTLCVPKITLQNVAVTVDLSSSNLTSVEPLSDLVVGEGNFTEFAGNITGTPLNGQPYNGLDWPPPQIEADPFVSARAGAIRLQLPAAVMQQAVQSPEGLTDAFVNNRFTLLSSDIYQRYLSLLARLLYFLDADDDINVRVQTVRRRVWLSDVAVHLLTAALLFFAVFGTAIHLIHRNERRDLRLLHPPGTLASAAAFTARTPIALLLDGEKGPQDMAKALEGCRFGMDRQMKIVMSAECK